MYACSTVHTFFCSSCALAKLFNLLYTRNCTTKQLLNTKNISKEEENGIYRYKGGEVFLNSSFNSHNSQFRNERKMKWKEMKCGIIKRRDKRYWEKAKRNKTNNKTKKKELKMISRFCDISRALRNMAFPFGCFSPRMFVCEFAFVLLRGFLNNFRSSHQWRCIFRGTRECARSWFNFNFAASAHRQTIHK